MNTDANECRPREGDEVDFGLWTTNVKPLRKSKKAQCKLLKDQAGQLSNQQRLL